MAIPAALSKLAVFVEQERPALTEMGFRVLEQDGQTIFPLLTQAEDESTAVGFYLEHVPTGRHAVVRVDPFDLDALARSGLCAKIREATDKMAHPQPLIAARRNDV